MAVAVQTNKTHTRLIVASNDTLPDTTIAFLKKVWNILEQLSRDYQDYNVAVPENSVSPRQLPTRDPSEDAQILVKDLRQMILRFGHQRVRRRISKHYSNILSINGELAEKVGLEPIITQLKTIKPALDQPALVDKIWDSIWIILENIRFRFDEFSDTIKTRENTPSIPFSLFRYLSKVVSVSQDIKLLMKAANSPRLRALFQRNFQIINLKGSGDIPFNLPRSRAGWTHLVEDTLRWRNLAAKEKGEVKFKLDKLNVEQHVGRMCETPTRNSNYVHCELNIISYILQSSEEGFLDCIGVSKLCCRGCA